MSKVKFLLVLVVVGFILSSGCLCERENHGGIPTAYKISRTKIPTTIDGDWDSKFWGDVTPLDIKNVVPIEFNGKLYDNPVHQPRTQAKVAYDDDFIYVIFRVEDKYVRAVAQGNHGKVWLDSCVEFFFTPGPDASVGYFNIETNCGGTMLFNYQLIPWQNQIPISEEDMQTIEGFHSEPKIVEPEKQQPTTWVIEYRIPIDILAKHCKIERPAPGVIWKANFYKCADATSHPHWLAWSPIEHESPTFHMPEFFGTLQFK